MLLLNEGQMGKAWVPSKSKALSEIGENWIEKYFHFICICFKVLKDALFTNIRVVCSSQWLFLSYGGGHFNRTTRYRTYVQGSQLKKKHIKVLISNLPQIEGILD
jgi:hypothetical protein